MKSFIISTLIGLAATGIHYVNAAALPNVATDVATNLGKSTCYILFTL